MLLLYRFISCENKSKATPFSKLSIFSIPQSFIQNILRYLLVILFTLSFSITSFAANIQDKLISESNKFDSNNLYLALVAEIYKEIGDEKQAVDYYYKLSVKNENASFAKRVTELATVSGQIAKALDGAKRWVELEPSNLEANQYLTLLFLRNSHFNASAKQLNKIRNLIESTTVQNEVTINHHSTSTNTFVSSESLTFVGALLAAEAHHDKALRVFHLYVNKYASKLPEFKTYQKQRQLINAELAMKAKNYLEVIENLKNLTGLDAINHVDAIVMNAKAHHKMNRNDEAIHYLESIQSHPQASDSNRLELVRLLVLEKQKAKALPILEALVVKHPKNIELLKSLIALEIDQSKLTNVDSNIKKLAEHDKYENEAYYFSGEFAEKLGLQEKALKKYSQVQDGSYLKNAHKKRIQLIKTIHGEKALNNFFDTELKGAETLSKKAYWLKLQGDEFFENRKYEISLRLYDKAVTLSPDTIRYRYRRGLANERLGNLKKAENDFNYVLTKRASDTDALNALGYMLSVHTDRYLEAKSYLSKAFKLKPNDPLILDSFGYVLFKTGDLIKAEKYLRKAYRLMKSPEVASHLISVLAKTNQNEEAQGIYNEMIKFHPESPSLKSVVHTIF